MDPQPTKDEWLNQALTIMECARTNQCNPPAFLTALSKLRITGPGSKQDKAKYRQYVTTKTTGTFQTVVAINRLKNVSMGFTRRCLTEYYKNIDGDVRTKVVDIANGATGIVARRAAALETLKNNDIWTKLDYHSVVEASAEQEHLGALKDFFRSCPTVEVPPIGSSVQDIDQKPFEFSYIKDRNGGRSGKMKPLDEERLGSLTCSSNTLVEILRMDIGKYKRVKEVKERDIEKDKEAIERVEQRRRMVEQNKSNASIWDDGTKTIPVAAVEQSFKQAEGEGVRFVAAREKAVKDQAEKEAKEVADKKKKDVEKKKKRATILKQKELNKNKRSEDTRKKKEDTKRQKKEEKKKKREQEGKRKREQQEKEQQEENALEEATNEANRVNAIRQKKEKKRKRSATKAAKEQEAFVEAQALEKTRAAASKGRGNRAKRGRAGPP